MNIITQYMFTVLMTKSTIHLIPRVATCGKKGETSSSADKKHKQMVWLPQQRHSVV